MNLSSEQLRAVDSQSATICMVAGPGSGKTRTLVERVKKLVEDGHIPEYMVIITFTNEAANELKKRTDFKFHYCGTLHGYMLLLLQKYGTRISLREETLTVINEELRDELLLEIQHKMGYKDTKQELKAALDLGPEKLKQIKTETGTLDNAQTTAWKYYQQLMQTSMVDYDAILHLGLMVVKTLESHDEKVLFLFVDEYQDSSPLDAAIYQALPIRNKFYVGDPDQAVYSFRGADVQNILDLANKSDVEVLYLEDNYRCDQIITQVAQRLIEHDHNRPAKRTNSISNNNGSAVLSSFPTAMEELEELAQRINALPDANEIAVLVRTNKLVEYFKNGLRGYAVDIPRERCESVPKDWRLTMLYLSLLCDPENDIIAYRWIRETQGLEAADQAKLYSMSAYEPINSISLKLPWMDPITPQQALNYLAMASLSPESIDRVRVSMKTLEDGDGLQHLISVLQFNDQMAAFHPTRNSSGGVTVTTIHGMKGREVDHVFLPAFEQGIIPSLSKNASLEEERRLAFVAVTRARHSMTISHSKVREHQWNGSKYTTEPSQFIKEMGL